MRTHKVTDAQLDELTHTLAYEITRASGRRLVLDELYELNDAIEAFLVAHDIDVVEK